MKIISYSRMVYLRRTHRGPNRCDPMICLSYFLVFNVKLTQAGRHFYIPQPRDVTSPPVTLITHHPSPIPSMLPSSYPSSSPSMMPSTAPSRTPTLWPSGSPSRLPSQAPSQSPTELPSTDPSTAPSLAPSYSPSQSPSLVPTYSPSQSPTVIPTELPSINPSMAPSLVPTYSPSRSPSRSPSKSPTVPTVVSTALPSSISPSIAPSQIPSYSPSPQELPSVNPSSSMTPSRFPSYSPSTLPTQSRNEDNGCQVSSIYLIGQQTPRGVTVPYKYQMEYMKESELDQIIESLENEINASLVRTSGFINCSTTSSRNLIERSVVGISSRPKDIVAEESCDLSTQVGVECNIFNGGLTLFYDPKKRQLGPVVEDTAKETKNMIKEMMEDGTLRDAHFAILNLTFIEAKNEGVILDSSTDDGGGDDSNLDGVIVPSYAWLILATGGIILTGLIGIFQCQGCIEEEIRSSEENSGESSTDNSLLVEEHLSESEGDFTSIVEGEKQLSDSSGQLLDISFSNSLLEENATQESNDVVEEDAETVVFSN